MSTCRIVDPKGVAIVNLHFAIYGERDNSHDLLGHSTQAPVEILSGIAGYTDLPPGHSAPWSSFLRGYAFGDYYIVSRTFPDTEAARGGMVRTFCVLLKLADARAVSDIGYVLSLLPNEISGWKCWPVAHDRASLLPMPATPIASYRSLLSKILASIEPVVFVGDKEFEANIRFLWAWLWPQARERLRFSICFDPYHLPPNKNRSIII